MQRTIQIAASPDAAATLIAEHRGRGRPSHQPGASIIPPGDVVTVHAINRATDAVMKAAQEARTHSQLSVVTTEIASVSDAEHQAVIDAMSTRRCGKSWKQAAPSGSHHG